MTRRARSISRPEAWRRLRVAVDQAERPLRDVVICDRCGATGTTYRNACKAGPADDCPGTIRLQQARSAAIRNGMS